MIVMIGDHNSSAIHYWAGKYGRVGRLLGPKAYNPGKVKPWLKWALDNDAFMAWKENRQWDEAAWMQMIVAAAKMKHAPMWALVPDVVTDKDATIKNWQRYSGFVKDAGIKTAFAAQDGMTPSDVPTDADVVFIGGSTEWKWKNAEIFCSAFERVHVGRVNSVDRCYLCQDLGAESVDGTGWFRDGTADWRFNKLEHFFAGIREPELFQSAVR